MPSEYMTARPAMETRSPRCTAPQLSAAVRTLAREQFGFAEPRGPIRNQSAVGRARDRVLVDTLGGREKARDEIAILAGRGDDYGEAVERGDGLAMSGFSASTSSSLPNTHKIIAGREHFLAARRLTRRSNPEGASQGCGGRAGKSRA